MPNQQAAIITKPSEGALNFPTLPITPVRKMRKIGTLLPKLTNYLLLFIIYVGTGALKFLKFFPINRYPFSRAMLSPLSSEYPTPGTLILSSLANSVREICPIREPPNWCYHTNGNLQPMVAEIGWTHNPYSAISSRVMRCCGGISMCFCLKIFRHRTGEPIMCI